MELIPLLALAACSTPLNVDTHKVGAWSTERSIIISSPMMELVDQRGELAFVTLHEAAHVALLHHYNPVHTIEDEFEADALAFTMMGLAGHSVCFGVSAMQDIEAVTDSPEFVARLKHWEGEFPQC